jgi:hypothetical protein
MAEAKKTGADEAAAAVVYVVARGVLSNGRDPKTKQRKVLNPGDEFKPADAEERDALLAAGTITTKDEFAKLMSPAAADLIKAANERAEAAEKKVAELQAAQKPAT